MRAAVLLAFQSLGEHNPGRVAAFFHGVKVKKILLRVLAYELSEIFSFVILLFIALGAGVLLEMMYRFVLKLVS